MITEDHINALKMFDSNGPLPFLQEGILQDTTMVDICDVVGALAGAETGAGCKGTLPEVLRTFEIPYGNANGPGSEHECRSVPASKFCHNYFSIFFDAPNYKEPRDENIVQSLFHPEIDKKDIFLQYLSSIDKKYPDRFLTNNENSDFDTENLTKLSDILLERNHYFRKLHSSLVDILKDSKVLIQESNLVKLEKIAIGLLLILWTFTNLTNGAGLFSVQPAFPYHGACYPDECTSGDIETNNVIFADQIFKHLNLNLIVASSPNLPDSMAMIVGADEETKELTQMSVVGCTDDDKYHEWRTENYLVVVLLSVIGFFILVGTILELIERFSLYGKTQIFGIDNTPGIGYKLLISFSLISNMEFIFQSSVKKGTNRLDCLEGMRAISMTWVIGGHLFGYGPWFLHTRNNEYQFELQGGGGGVALEALIQGEFSVDSFLFIGATLLSFLLLKDLDKSNGWFHKNGIIRMLLFYLNRILRITIPYGLVLAVFIGFMPLVIREPLGPAQVAYYEAEMCKIYGWRHITYIHLFGGGAGANDMCLGHTWYLAFDMMLFIVSPLIIYPLWRTKNGYVDKIIGISWWTLLFVGSLGATVAWTLNSTAWEKYASDHSLPGWNFAPWGYRNHCYLMGIMMGYILHVTKDKKVNLDSKLVLIIWQVVFLIGCGLIYGPHYIEDQNLPGGADTKANYALRKLGWGICLSWVTFACVKGFGGLVNDFLSWGFWIPISKISFMTYLFHMSMNWYYYAAQTYIVDISLWLLTATFISQVIVDLFVGLLACLALELPFGRLQKLLIQLMVTGGKT